MYQQYLWGLTCKVLSLVGFCLLSLLFETAALPFNPLEQFGILCLIGSALLIPVVSIGFREQLKIDQPKLYFLRALTSIGAMVTWIEAVGHIGAGEAILMSYLTPILVICLASFCREEPFNRTCFLAAGACLGVMIWVLHPRLELELYGLSMGFLSVLLWALYELICKKQTKNEHFLVQVCYTFGLSGLFLLPFTLGALAHLTADNLMVLSSMALLRIANVALLFLALKWAQLNGAACVSYLKFPILATLGLIFFDKHIQLHQVWATAFLIAINIIVLNIRKRSFIQNAKPAPA